MPVSNTAAKATPAVDLESDAPLRIDCYVRSSVPAAVSGTINDVVERLSRLSERDRIDEYRIVRWPPECHAVDPTAADRSRTRDELVTEFERWATRRDHSLEPAFSRREVPTSPFDSGDESSRERVRVPVIALAVRETNADSGTGAATRDDAEESLRGVVPYTEQTQSGATRTYTVDEWLSIVGPDDSGRHVGPSDRNQPQRLEGRQ